MSVGRSLSSRQFIATPSHGMGGIFDDLQSAVTDRVKSEVSKAAQDVRTKSVKLPKKRKLTKQTAAPVVAPVVEESFLEKNKVAVGLGLVVIALLAIRKWGPK